MLVRINAMCHMISLQRDATKREKVLSLIDELMRVDNASYDLFVECLQKTKQHELASALAGKEGENTHYVGSSDKIVHVYLKTNITEGLYIDGGGVGIIIFLVFVTSQISCI